MNFLGNPKAPWIPHSVSEQGIIRTETKPLLRKGVIVETSTESAAFISRVFAKKNKSGTSRFILILKHLNDFFAYKHFTMYSILDAFKLIKKGASMTSVDFKNAFFTILINE